MYLVSNKRVSSTAATAAVTSFACGPPTLRLKCTFGACMHACSKANSHAHTLTHILVMEYSGVRCLCFVVVFFLGKVGSLECLCMPACLCVSACVWVNMCSMAALSVGLLLLALSFFTLFTNCHHYCDYHHITQHTFIETGKCLLLWFI